MIPKIVKFLDRKTIILLCLCIIVSILNSCGGDITVRYLAGSEVIFSDSEHFTRILLTHGIDKKGFEVFKTLQSGLELHIKGNTIIRCYDKWEDKSTLEGKNIRLPITEWEDHKLFFLCKRADGVHKLGGTKPDGLKMPKHNRLNSPFQYIGTIDCKDEYFNWIPLTEFHIIYPVYECNFGIFLDYSNPLEPKLIEPITFDNAWYEIGMEDLDVQYTEIRYDVTEYFDMKIEEENKEDQLICGVPLWYQAPEIPVSPVTGKVMKFVCTINSDNQLKVTNYGDIPQGLISDYLIFADYGHLYVFFEPETKIAHLNIQF